MAISFNKRELEKKKEQKRQEKQKRKEERKASGSSKSFEDMIAYVDENGVITDVPPELNKHTIEAEDITISTPKKDDVEESALEGYIEYFNPDKGYGFIKNKNNKEKYFFHISSATVPISEGDKVTYELERGQKGMNAVNIAHLTPSDKGKDGIEPKE